MPITKSGKPKKTVKSAIARPPVQKGETASKRIQKITSKNIGAHRQAVGKRRQAKRDSR